jgi:hypothetical protein
MKGHIKCQKDEWARKKRKFKKISIILERGRGEKAWEDG